nr:MAG: hypothetical protein [Bacteriophage sp.]
MTNIYARISDGDAPKTQQVTQVSFVDETGKHIDVGTTGETGAVLTKLRAITALASDADLPTVTAKVNEILAAVAKE